MLAWTREQLSEASWVPMRTRTRLEGGVRLTREAALREAVAVAKGKGK
ncbi:hypothetical protein [Siccirubricoccus sp. G192]|nr:hypothetical protein [Siccirubricoccus sp. G192]MBV1797517.1 hypothetical protein [Siccirubricoccus sp. G192]